MVQIQDLDDYHPDIRKDQVYLFQILFRHHNYIHFQFHQDKILEYIYCLSLVIQCISQHQYFFKVNLLQYFIFVIIIANYQKFKSQINVMNLGKTNSHKHYFANSKSSSSQNNTEILQRQSQDFQSDNYPQTNQIMASKQNQWIGNLINNRNNKLTKSIFQKRGKNIIVDKSQEKSQQQQFKSNDQIFFHQQELSSDRIQLSGKKNLELEKLNSQIKQLKKHIQKLQIQNEIKSAEISRFKGLSEVKEPTGQNQHEKAIYMKEITMKNIQINKLRESQLVIRSQNQTLNLFLRQKQTQIEQLNNKIEQINFQKKKMEDYQIRFNQSNNALRDIQNELKNIMKDTKLKDKLLEQNKLKIQNFISQNKIYQQKIIDMQKRFTELLENKNALIQDCQEAQKQSEEWKKNYLLVNRKAQQLYQIQIKYKNISTTNKDLQLRINNLLETNQKLKLQINSQSTKDRKISELQVLYQNQLKLIREKDEQISNINQQLKYVKQKLESIIHYQQENMNLERNFQQKIKQLKSVQRKLEQKNIIIASNQRQLKRIKQQNDKFKDRNQKIDQIYKENKRLTTLLMEKINQIQKLEHTINSLDSKMGNLSNQNLKLNIQHDQFNSIINQLRSDLESLKHKYQIQYNTRIQLQDRLEKCKIQLNIFNTNLNKQKQRLKVAFQERENFKKQLQNKSKLLDQETSKFEINRSKWETQLNHEKTKSEELTQQIKQSKKRNEILLKKEKENVETAKNFQKQIQKLTIQLNNQASLNKQFSLQNSKLLQWKSNYIKFMQMITNTSEQMRNNSKLIN